MGRAARLFDRGRFFPRVRRMVRRRLGMCMSGSTSYGVTIGATAHYLPERVVTNSDLEKVMDTSDEWIVQRTGVRERHFCAEGESTREMSFEVLKSLLRDSGTKPEELDLVGRDLQATLEEFLHVLGREFFGEALLDG